MSLCLNSGQCHLTTLLSIFNVLYLCICVYIWVYVHMRVGAYGGFSELELQVVVSSLQWVLGTELGSIWKSSLCS